MNKQAGSPVEALAPKGSQPASANSAGKAGSGKAAAKSESEKKAFDAELTQAGQAAAAQAQAQAQATASAVPTLPKGDAAKTDPAVPGEKPVVPGAFANGLQAPAKQGLASAAERSPQTLKAAASSTTVSALTGLKPWSRDWVFDGEPMPTEAPKLERPASDLPQTPLPASGPALKKAAPAMQMDATRGNAETALARRLTDASSDAASAASATPASASTAAGAPTYGLVQGSDASLLSAAELGAYSLEDDGEGSAGEATGLNGARSRPPALAAKVRPQSLSGAEFLSTLNAVKGRPEASLQQGDLRRPPTGGPGFTVIEGGGLNKGRRNVIDDLSAAQYSNTTAHGAADKLVPNAFARPGVPEVAGHVTVGANAENRLSSEALINVSGGIRGLTAQGGGEMRIRLKPENLGELHVRVVTDGKNVALHVQASDDRSKKIIEESISHLKDSLAGQNLALANVDLTIANAGAQTGFGEPHPQAQSYFGQNPQHQSQAGFGQEQSQGRGSYAREYDGGAGPGVTPMATLAARNSAQASLAAASGRIDVQA